MLQSNYGWKHLIFIGAKNVNFTFRNYAKINQSPPVLCAFSPPPSFGRALDYQSHKGRFCNEEKKFCTIFFIAIIFCACLISHYKKLLLCMIMEQDKSKLFYVFFIFDRVHVFAIYTSIEVAAAQYREWKFVRGTKGIYWQHYKA